jgi:hypothetical protein
VAIQFGKFTSGTTGAVQNPGDSAITEGDGTSPAVSFDSEPFSTIATWIGAAQSPHGAPPKGLLRLLNVSPANRPFLRCAKGSVCRLQLRHPVLVNLRRGRF